MSEALNGAGLDRSMPEFENCYVVFLTELLCGGGYLVSGITGECLSSLKSKQFVVCISGLDDSIGQQNETVATIEIKT